MWRMRSSSGVGNSDIGRAWLVMPVSRSCSTNRWPLRGVNERDVVELADAVAFALLEAVLGGEILALGLDDRHGDGLGAGLQWNAQDVVGAAGRAAVASAVDDVHGGGGDLNPDVGAWPTALVDQAGIDQLKAGLGFVAGHQRGRLGLGGGAVVQGGPRGSPGGLVTVQLCRP